MLFLDRQAWLFSLKTYAAAIAALYVALAGNLSRPYWAMATVYIVTQPMVGPTNSKGVHRIIGTVVAGAATILLVPNLAETPLVLSGAISLWLSLCLFLALINRGPRVYAFMLAGYTTAFIGFPAVTSPETTFDTVIARSEEIFLGALMAMLFASLLFPNSVKPMIKGRIGAWMSDAAQWCRMTLLHNRKAEEPRNRLAADLAQFEALIEFLRLDDPRIASSVPALDGMHERLLLLMPTLSSIADRLTALRANGRMLPEGLEQLIEDIGGWIEGEHSNEGHGHHAALRERVAALKPLVDRDIDHLLLNTLLLRLEELIDLWQDCNQLKRAIEHDHLPTPAQGVHYRIRTKKPLQRTHHIDFGMAMFSALAAGMATFAYCVLWILSGWPGGSFGAMLGAVAAAFFASQDDPTPSMMSFLTWAVVSSFVVGIYNFGILPAVHDFGMLVLVLAPIFVFLGMLLCRPKTAMIGLPMLANTATLLGLQSNYRADFESFLNSSVSMIVGMVFAIVFTRLFRSVGAEWTARRLVRQGWQTLAEAAEGRNQEDRRLFAARMVDLLGLLAPRLAATPPGSELASVDMLLEARIGLNILQLRRARYGLPPASRAAVERILDDVAGHYRAQVAAKRLLPCSDHLRELLDASLRRVGTIEPGKARDEGLMGLIGLRYALFPSETPAVGEDPTAEPAAG